MFSWWRLYLSFRALKLWGHKAALLALREGLWLKPAVKNSLTELNEKYSPCFFLLHHHYLIPFLLFATSMASGKDIKATGYIFITSNHIVFTASVYEAAAENENIFMALEALSSRLFIREGGKKLPKKPRWIRNAGNKKRKQIVSLPSLCGGPSSPFERFALTLWWGRADVGGGGWGGVSYLTFPFYLPGFRALVRGVLVRGQRGVAGV